LKKSENVTILLDNISRVEKLSVRVVRRDLAVIISCAVLSRFRTSHQIVILRVNLLSADNFDVF